MSLHAEVPRSNGYQLLWHYGCRWSMPNALILARNVKAKGIVARPPIPDVNIDADIDTDKLYGNEEVNTELERLSALFSWGLHFLEGELGHPITDERVRKVAFTGLCDRDYMTTKMIAFASDRGWSVPDLNKERYIRHWRNPERQLARASYLLDEEPRWYIEVDDAWERGMHLHERLETGELQKTTKMPWPPLPIPGIPITEEAQTSEPSQ